MKRIFVSYAREDKTKVDELTRRLPQLGYDVWVDTELRGGQSWWDEIIGQIAGCDVFLAVVSHASLNSNACHLERSYASALGKPLLPVAVEEATQAMPRELSVRQVVNYTAPGEDAAFALAGALASMPIAGPLPETMPTPPTAPLSYLIDLVEVLNTPELTKAQQRQVLDELEPGLRSSDREERAGAQEILRRISGREDLFADVASRIEALEAGGDGPGSARSGSQERSGPPPPAPATAAAPGSPPSPEPRKKTPKSLVVSIILGTTIAVFTLMAIVGIVFMDEETSPDPLPPNPPPVTSAPPSEPVPIPTAGPSGLDQYVGMPCYIYDEFGVRVTDDLGDIVGTVVTDGAGAYDCNVPDYPTGTFFGYQWNVS